MTDHTFYHAALMPDDKRKILLAVWSNLDNVNNFETYKILLTWRIAGLIEEAEAGGEAAYELIENFLGICTDIFHKNNQWDIAWQVIESPQMQSLLHQTRLAWKEIDLSAAKPVVSGMTTSNRSVSEDTVGFSKTKEFFEEMTLRYYLEHLSTFE